jgi:hypothetical protein
MAENSSLANIRQMTAPTTARITELADFFKPQAGLTVSALVAALVRPEAFPPGNLARPSCQ